MSGVIVSILHFDRKDPENLITDLINEFDKGLPVVLPTETLYGIGAPISNTDAVQKIFDMKKRPRDLTLAVAVGNLPMVDDLAVIHRWQKNTLRENLPGPVTFILNVKSLSDTSFVRKGTIAVRVPRHPIFIPLCSKVGPLVLTSANLHGDPDVHKAELIDKQFGGEILVIEDDGSLSGCGSAVIDLTEEVATILREGNLNIDELMGGDHGRG
jgi:L-threonylcarbamoyladenylate synthase